jgi:hypothetical protein
VWKGLFNKILATKENLIGSNKGKSTLLLFVYFLQGFSNIVYYGQLLKRNKSVIKFKSFHASRGHYLLFVVFCLFEEDSCYNRNPKCYVVFDLGY